MRFRLLGPVEVLGAAGPLALGGPKQRTVLAYLVLRHGQHVTADRLIDEVWGDEATASVRTSLQSYVSRLRRLLGPDRIVGHAGGYVLQADPEEVDVDRFEQLLGDARHAALGDLHAAAALHAEAQQVWRGPALADLRDQPALRPDVARLDELRLTSLEEQIEVELALGRHATVLPRLEELVSRFPLRERLWSQVMVALYRAGRQSDALAAYQKVRAGLAEHLGIDPSSSLQLIQKRILDQDPALDPEGTPLRGYRLLEPLGTGALGVTHRAHQPQVGRDVAVKVVDAELADHPDFVRRFEREAQRIASLEHPHLVPIHDYWREPGGAFVVMRYLPGGNLRDHLRTHRVDRERAAAQVDQLAGALAFLHRQGVVHGDVRAENVLLDEEGNAYLTDVALALGTGLADRIARTAGHAERSDVAPEVAAGDPADARADVYGLGRVVEAIVGVADAVDGSALDEVVRRATATRPEDRYDGVEVMVAALGAAMASERRTSEVLDAQEPRNPYKGLHPFQTADAGDFFGRDDLVARVVARLARDDRGGRFVAVVGPSGSGKSSLVRAGVVPSLAKGALPGSADWYVVQMTPGTDPWGEFALALRTVATTPLRLDAATIRTIGLHAAMRRALPAVSPCTLLLVLDQFEELFTLTADPVERTRFLASLAAAVDHQSGGFRVLATIRADHYDQPLGQATVAELVAGGTVPLVPLTGDQLGEAIARPAQQVGVAVDAALVSLLATDAADASDSLPLLQYALTELFERRSGSSLDVAGYRDIGGMWGSLAGRAETVHGHLSAPARAAARALFLRLVVLTDDRGVARRPVLRTGLAGDGGDAAARDEILDAFGSARLLSFDRDPVSRAPTVAVAHEALLREWPRLATWIDEAREDLVQQQRIVRATREWEENGRDDSFLARGTRLDHFEALRASVSVSLGPRERDFLDASVDRRDRDRRRAEEQRTRERDLERRAHRRLRATVAVLALTAMVGTTLTVFAVGQRNDAQRQARLAAARGLVSAATTQLDRDVELSLLLGLEAVETTRGPDDVVVPGAVQLLHDALVRARLERRVPGVGGHLALSPDGEVFVTEGPDGTGLVDVRDAATGRSLHAFVGHGGDGDTSPDLNAVAFSPDGRWLATAGDDGTLRVWDRVWETGEDSPLLVVDWDEPGGVWDPSFSPDGSLVAAAWADDGVVRVIEVDSGEIVVEVEIGDSRDRSGAYFSPDGGHLAFLGREGVSVVEVPSGRDVFAAPSTVLDVAAWSPDGTRIAANDGSDVMVWDARDGSLLRALRGSSQVLAIAWDEMSGRLAAGAIDGTTSVWDVVGGGTDPVLMLPDADQPVSGLAFSPDGERLFGGEEGGPGTVATLVWDLSDAAGGEVANLPGDAERRAGATFVGDRDDVVVAAGEGRLITYDVATGEAASEIAASQNPDVKGVEWVNDMAVSPDGGRLAWTGGNHARVRDVTVGRDLLEVTDDAIVVPVAWHPDGRHLAIASGASRAQVLDEAGEAVASWQVLGGDGFPVSLAFSPDGASLAVGSAFGMSFVAPPRVEIWDWRDRMPGDEPRVDVPGSQAAFGPDGSWVVVADAEPGRLAIHDAVTGEERVGWIAHVGPIGDLTVSPDGSVIASSGDDATVKLWDAATGHQELELHGHGASVLSVDFSPDGTRLVTAEPGQVRVWALDSDELVQLARERVTRGLTADECRQYLQAASCDEP